MALWRHMRPRRTAYVQVYPPCPAVYVSRGVRLSSFKARGSLLQRGSWVTPPGAPYLFEGSFREAFVWGDVRRHEGCATVANSGALPALEDLKLIGTLAIAAAKTAVRAARDGLRAW